jgi:hypothetical protein
MTTVHFGTQSEFVRMEISPTFTREGWVTAVAEISVKGFQGTIRPSFETHDFLSFFRQLQELYRTLKGEAVFTPREEQLTLRIVAATGGRMHLSGEAWSEAKYGNKLEFELELDQTFLAEPLKQLEGMQLGGGDA